MNAWAFFMMILLAVYVIINVSPSFFRCLSGFCFVIVKFLECLGGFGIFFVLSLNLSILYWRTTLSQH